MFQEFEKETKTSTAKSLLGALTGLGAGFVFMFLGLVALSNVSSKVSNSELVRSVRESLEHDLMSAERASFHLAPDGHTLRFKTHSASAQHQISYRIEAASGQLRREQDGVSYYLVTLPGARFRSQNGLIVLSWKSPSGDARCSWAVDRWSRKRSR